MKMFFATDITLPFDSLREVLKAFPTWNLVYMYGNDAFFEVPASQVILTPGPGCIKKFALSKPLKSVEMAGTGISLEVPIDKLASIF